MGRAGKALRKVLQTHGISQNRLAVMMEVDRSNISRWVSETRDPTAEAVAEIKDALEKLDPAAAEEFVMFYLYKTEAVDGAAVNGAAVADMQSVQAEPVNQLEPQPLEQHLVEQEANSGNVYISQQEFNPQPEFSPQQETNTELRSEPAYSPNPSYMPDQAYSSEEVQQSEQSYRSDYTYPSEQLSNSEAEAQPEFTQQSEQNYSSEQEYSRQANLEPENPEHSRQSEREQTEPEQPYQSRSTHHSEHASI